MDREGLENIDIDEEILENIDTDKILNQLDQTGQLPTQYHI